ncbi:hypothetical protein TrCOL_g8056 [Triparma columacea]|uniref:tRNA (guanine-N(7)-)-methyltransferase n=1 Tax=Triparma columacea TaxID=722753 RepID=A0A9W7GRA7_9STRA|nr:hypothetical protein TrCOL_g8056 [Triparma columacea]
MSDQSVEPPAAKKARYALPPTIGLEDYKFTDGEAITQENAMPQKKYYRSRAHANPLSFNDNLAYPLDPQGIDWTTYYSEIKGECHPTVLDIGCGFGGLTVALAPLLPSSRIMGMEIRAKVSEYVRLRIMSLRNETPGTHQNAAVIRANTMKNLLNFIAPGTLEKIFICFPDPHFKAKNHRRRIVTYDLLTEYAYVLSPGSKLYLITDVEELHNWHVEKSDSHEMFTRIPDEEAIKDPCVKLMIETTEEGKKVERSGSNKYWAVYRRVEATPPVNEANFFS